MRYKDLAKTGEKVSAIGLGTMGMTEVYGKTDDIESIATLHRALELGVNFWDTADMYGNGANEEVISKVLTENRDKVFIATKFGFRLKNGGSPFINETYLDASPEWIKTAVENSLRRLKIDTIDLYYAHRVDPNVPVEVTVDAMAELVKAGKIRYIGLSECTPEDLKKANAVHPISAVQSEYSLLTRGPEDEILPLTRQLGITFIPFAPLGRGLITGKLNLDELASNDFRSRLPRYSGEYRENNENLAAALADLARNDYGATPAQLALAWVCAKGDNIIPIPGTKHRKYLEENVKAIDISLTKEGIDKIEAILMKYSNIGARYSSREKKFLKK